MTPCDLRVGAASDLISAWHQPGMVSRDTGFQLSCLDPHGKHPSKLPFRLVHHEFWPSAYSVTRNRKRKRPDLLATCCSPRRAKSSGNLTRNICPAAHSHVTHGDEMKLKNREQRRKFGLQVYLPSIWALL